MPPPAKPKGGRAPSQAESATRGPATAKPKAPANGKCGHGRSPASQPGGASLAQHHKEKELKLQQQNEARVFEIINLRTLLLKIEKERGDLRQRVEQLEEQACQDQQELATTQAELDTLRQQARRMRCSLTAVDAQIAGAAAAAAVARSTGAGETHEGTQVLQEQLAQALAAQREALRDKADAEMRVADLEWERDQLQEAVAEAAAARQLLEEQQAQSQAQAGAAAAQSPWPPALVSDVAERLRLALLGQVAVAGEGIAAVAALSPRGRARRPSMLVGGSRQGERRTQRLDATGGSVATAMAAAATAAVTAADGSNGRPTELSGKGDAGADGGETAPLLPLPQELQEVVEAMGKVLEDKDSVLQLRLVEIEHLKHQHQLEVEDFQRTIQALQQELDQLKASRPPSAQKPPSRGGPLVETTGSPRPPKGTGGRSTPPPTPRANLHGFPPASPGTGVGSGVGLHTPPAKEHSVGAASSVALPNGAASTQAESSQGTGSQGGPGGTLTPERSPWDSARDPRPLGSVSVGCKAAALGQDGPPRVHGGASGAGAGAGAGAGGVQPPATPPEPRPDAGTALGPGRLGFSPGSPEVGGGADAGRQLLQLTQAELEAAARQLRAVALLYRLDPPLSAASEQARSSILDQGRHLKVEVAPSSVHASQHGQSDSTGGGPAPTSAASPDDSGPGLVSGPGARETWEGLCLLLDRLTALARNPGSARNTSSGGAGSTAAGAGAGAEEAVVRGQAAGGGAAHALVTLPRRARLPRLTAGHGEALIASLRNSRGEQGGAEAGAGPGEDAAEVPLKSRGSGGSDRGPEVARALGAHLINHTRSSSHHESLHHLLPQGSEMFLDPHPDAGAGRGGREGQGGAQGMRLPTLPQLGRRATWGQGDLLHHHQAALEGGPVGEGGQGEPGAGPKGYGERSSAGSGAAAGVALGVHEGSEDRDEGSVSADRGSGGERGSGGGSDRGSGGERGSRGSVHIRRSAVAGHGAGAPGILGSEGGGESGSGFATRSSVPHPLPSIREGRPPQDSGPEGAGGQGGGPGEQGQGQGPRQEEGRGSDTRHSYAQGQGHSIPRQHRRSLSGGKPLTGSVPGFGPSIGPVFGPGGVTGPGLEQPHAPGVPHTPPHTHPVPPGERARPPSDHQHHHHGAGPRYSGVGEGSASGSMLGLPPRPATPCSPPRAERSAEAGIGTRVGAGAGPGAASAAGVGAGSPSSAPTAPLTGIVLAAPPPPPPPIANEPSDASSSSSGATSSSRNVDPEAGVLSRAHFPRLAESLMSLLPRLPGRSAGGRSRPISAGALPPSGAKPFSLTHLLASGRFPLPGPPGAGTEAAGAGAGEQGAEQRSEPSAARKRVESLFGMPRSTREGRAEGRGGEGGVLAGRSSGGADPFTRVSAGAANMGGQTDAGSSSGPEGCFGANEGRRLQRPLSANAAGWAVWGAAGSVDGVGGGPGGAGKHEVKATAGEAGNLMVGAQAPALAQAPPSAPVAIANVAAAPAVAHLAAAITRALPSSDAKGGPEREDSGVYTEPGASECGREDPEYGFSSFADPGETGGLGYSGEGGAVGGKGGFTAGGMSDVSPVIG